MEPVIPDGIPTRGLTGVGFYSTYRKDSVVPGDITGNSIPPEILPGLPSGFDGIVILMLDKPADVDSFIDIVTDRGEYLFSHWLGRFDYEFDTMVYVNPEGRSYIGMRRVRPGGAWPIWVGVYPDKNISEFVGDDLDFRLMNSWPATGTALSDSPYLSMIVPGLLLIFVVFHTLNLLLMKIKYRGKWVQAVGDPVIAHVLLLVFGSIFAPFLGLGWLVGAYVAGRFLVWRHTEAKRAWLMMVVYALLLASAYEAIFYGPLWV
jgi:hypothetical protein